MGFLAPAGTPVTLRDVAAAWVHGRHDEPLAVLAGMLEASSETEACWGFSSGRAAMVVALTAMSRLAGGERDEVIVPAYTCYSVPAAVIRAGLRPVFCDVDPHTLSLDLAQLEGISFDRVLAVVTANLYGLPNQLVEIEKLVRRRGVMMLDDAAQALGARVGGRPVGGFGDAGLFSFDKGKNIPTVQGGAIVSRNTDFIAAMNAVYFAVPPQPSLTSWLTVAKLIPYAMLLRPAWYGLARRLPGLKLGRTVYETDYPITRYGSPLARIAVRLAGRLDAFNAQRRSNAERLRQALHDLPGVVSIAPVAGAEPVYVRYPIRCVSQSSRRAILASLEAQGIGATGSYPEALPDVPEIRAAVGAVPGGFAGARAVARSIITLPTHAYCPPGVFAQVRAAIAQVVD